VIEDVDEACVMMSKDEKFLNNNFINEFVLDNLINEKEIEFINDEESSEKNSK